MPASGLGRGQGSDRLLARGRVGVGAEAHGRRVNGTKAASAGLGTGDAGAAKPIAAAAMTMTKSAMVESSSIVQALPFIH